MIHSLFCPALLILIFCMLLKFFHVQTIFEFTKCLLKLRIVLFVYQKLFILWKGCINTFLALCIIVMHTRTATHFVHQVRLGDISTSKIFQNSLQEMSLFWILASITWNILMLAFWNTRQRISSWSSIKEQIWSHEHILLRIKLILTCHLLL